MSKKIVRVYFVVLFISLFSCLEEEEIQRDYPKVTTLSVSEITPFGAKFSGVIQSGFLEDVQTYGFVWGTDEKLKLENSFSIELSDPEVNEVTTTIRSTLVKSLTYFVRFYVKVKGKTIYGNIVEFISLGSEGPVITELRPQSGTIGDTVLIKGRNFYTKSNTLLVSFEDRSAKVISVTDSTLKVIVPEPSTFDLQFLSISASIQGNITYAPKKFELELAKIIPKINSVFPTKVLGCDTVYIVGENFKSTSNEIMVSLQNHQSVELLKATNDSIVIKLAALPPGDLGIKVHSGRFDFVTDNDFEEVRPSFVSISPTVVRPGSLITLKVKNFPMCIPVGVFGVPGEVVSFGGDEIKFKISETCLPESFSLNIGSYHWQTMITTPLITTAGAEITSIVPNHGVPGQEVVIQGKYFYDLTQWDMEFLEITEYTSTEIRGVVQVVHAPDGKVDVVVNSCNSRTILDDGFTFDPPIIYDINPKIVTARDQLITVTGKNFINGNYYKSGLSFVSGTSYEQIISQDENHITFSSNALITDEDVEAKFDSWVKLFNPTGMVSESPVNITVDYDAPWKQLSDFKGASRFSAISFAINGKGYLGMGSRPSSEYLYDFWEFDPATMAWTEKNPYPGTQASMSEIGVVNGKAYILVAGIEIWSYDPSSDHWKKETEYPGSSATYMFAMAIDDKIFMGGGYWGVVSREFWELNPSTAIWTRKEDIPEQSVITVHSLVYSVGGMGYTYSKNLTSGLLNKLRYNPVTDDWSSSVVPDFQPTESNITTTAEATIVFGSPLTQDSENVMYLADPINGDLSPLPYAGPNRYYAAGFMIGDVVYLGTGVSLGGGLLKDFWKFDPKKLK